MNFLLWDRNPIACLAGAAPRLGDKTLDQERLMREQLARQLRVPITRNRRRIAAAREQFFGEL